MIAVTADRRNTLELVERVSLAGAGGVSLPAFLEGVCGAVSEALGFDSVTAVQFHPGAEEVSEVAAAGASPEQAGCRPIAGDPLLAEALDSQSLVLVSGD